MCVYPLLFDLLASSGIEGLRWFLWQASLGSSLCHTAQHCSQAVSLVRPHVVRAKNQRDLPQWRPLQRHSGWPVKSALALKD
jgi:hypothetical protein